MKPKKNPKADLRKYSSLFFAVGLCVVLFASWKIAEIKTQHDAVYYKPLEPIFNEEELIPVTVEQRKIQPPPVHDPVDFDIKPDDDPSVEDLIKPTEPVPDEIIPVVVSVDPPIVTDVPFIVVEDVPLFPGCERVKKSERRKCFQDNIQRHIIKNFRYPEIAQEMGVQGRVYVQFVIDKDGSITSIRSRGPDKNLEQEAERIISKLPKMTPGKQRGQPVRVPFSIPVHFSLQ